jgi:hypothetical protein
MIMREIARGCGARLHRNSITFAAQEAFLAAEHPLRAKFARLTRLEEAKGLYADACRIRMRDGWATVPAAKGLRLSGIGWCGGRRGAAPK